MSKIRIIIVDDHDIIIDGIKAMLYKEPDIEVISEAKNGREAIEQAKSLNPDIMIMDISMPEISGIEATIQIKSILPGIRILALSQHEEKEYVTEILKAGADGYLLKNSKKDELVEAIKTIVLGEKYLGRSISGLMINSFINTNAKDKIEKDVSVTLTRREIDILKLIANDLSNQEIGDQLNISLRTVETHRRNLMQKLNVKTVVALVKYAIKNNIVDIV